MLLGTRFGLCLLALSLNFSDAFSALNQPAPFASTMQNSTDGAAIRTLAEAFYKTWAAKDLDGFLSLWSAKAPELEARKKATGALYAGSERIELSDLRTRKVAMAGDCAIVLSACETARGRASAGEGMIGLSWAMFVAGAPATVVSQWKVESASTRDLMLGFHRRLTESSKTAKSRAT